MSCSLKKITEGFCFFFFYIYFPIKPIIQACVPRKQEVFLLLCITLHTISIFLKKDPLIFLSVFSKCDFFVDK